MADIKQIEGYWIKDASARTMIDDISARIPSTLPFVRYDTNQQGLSATEQTNARTNIAAAASSHTHSNYSPTNHNHDSSYLSLTGGTLTGAVYTGLDFSLVPINNGNGNIGDSLYRYNNIYSFKINIDTIESANATGNTMLNCSLLPNSTCAIGNSTNMLKDLYSHDIHIGNIYNLAGSIGVDSVIYPIRTTAIDLGSVTNRWNNIYVLTVNASDNINVTGNINSSSKIVAAGSITSNVCMVAPYFLETSDINKKNIISDIDLNKAYDLIDKCSTIIYTLKDDPAQKEQIGAIAQEVQEFFPELIETDNDGTLTLSYSRLTVIIMKVMKDLIKRIEKLENK